jgi:hypothetical protein
MLAGYVQVQLCMISLSLTNEKDAAGTAFFFAVQRRLKL